MTERDVLRRAKEVLLERGWRSDGRYSGVGGGVAPVCLLGALGVAAGNDPYHFAPSGRRTNDPIVHLVGEHVPPLEAVGEDGDRISEWNDEYASFEDVIALLDKALNSLEVTEQEMAVA